MIHNPVLLNEVIDLMKLSSGDRVIDCTLGAGGHSEAILNRILPGGKLLSIDRDETIVEKAKKRLDEFKGDVVVVVGLFSELERIAKENGFEKVNAVLFDLGVSSFQLDDSQRGFSYLHDNARLDMRMGNSDMTGGDVLNNYDLKKLTAIFKNYGQIPRAKTLARRIISSRRAKSFLLVSDLKDVVDKTGIAGFDSRRLMARVWQSIRMEVNQEMEELRQGLESACRLLERGGRLAVISFHSVEDGFVKNFFREKSRGCVCPKEFPECVCNTKPALKIITKKAVTPSEQEIVSNIRSKSAKLRLAIKN